MKPLTVWLASGTYPREETFELGKGDSGTAASPIVYRAVAGQEVRLSGGREIPPQAFQVVRDAAMLGRLDWNHNGESQ